VRPANIVTLVLLLAVVVSAGVSAQVTPTSEWISLWSEATTLNTNPVPVGSMVRVYDPDGVLCGEYQVTAPGGYGLLPVYRDDAFTPVVDEGAEPGDTLRFTIDGLPAQPSGTDAVVWTQNGDVVSVDLAAETVFPTSEWVSFWSDATQLGGVPVAPGAVVRAYDPGGVLCGQFTVVTPGSYGLMPVYRDDPSTGDFDEGADAGDDIAFTIDGVDATAMGPDAAVWSANGYVGNVDLSGVFVSTTLLAANVEVVGGAVEIRWTLDAPVHPNALLLLRRPARDGNEELTGLAIERWDVHYAAVDRKVDAGVTYMYRLRIDDGDGIDVIELGSARIDPPAFALSPAYPNPFKNATTLRFDLTVPAAVTLVVHDAAGRTIRRLLSGKTYPAGSHEVSWDGHDRRGRDVPAGVYFVRVHAGKFTANGKITLVR
jgi:hypothetical protein